jgi:hypothetical protein
VSENEIFQQVSEPAKDIINERFDNTYIMPGIAVAAESQSSVATLQSP